MFTIYICVYYAYFFFFVKNFLSGQGSKFSWDASVHVVLPLEVQCVLAQSCAAMFMGSVTPVPLLL